MPHTLAEDIVVRKGRGAFGIASDRVRAGLELAGVVSLIEIDLWRLCGDFTVLYRLIAFPLLAGIMWQAHRRRGREHAHTQTPDGRSEWLLTLLATVVFGLSILAAGQWLRSEGEQFRTYWATESASWLLAKGVTVGVQQLALHLFLLPSFLTLWGNRTAAWFSAAIVFGLLHLPSPALVLLTGFAALVWSWLYARGRLLTPLILSHFLLAVATHAALPEWLNYNMRVGSAGAAVQEQYRQLQAEPLATLLRVLQSDAYFAAQGRDQRRFVVAIYQLLVRRTPAENEIAIWLNLLRCQCRADMAAGFLTGQEFGALWRRHAAAWPAQLLQEAQSALRDGK